MAADKYHCIGCRKNVAATAEKRYRKHDREKGTECSRSRRDIPTWLLARGPETAPDDVRPVIGRDYAKCPECGRSPQLDLTTGHFIDHVRDVRVPLEKREQCPMSDKPYVPEGEPCPSGPSGTAAGPSPATTTPPAQDVTGQAPTQDAAPAPTGPESTEAEEMISQWAATAREIEDRELPPPYPESTPTPKGSPPRQSAHHASGTATAPPQPEGTAKDVAHAEDVNTSTDPVACHIAVAHPPHRFMHKKRVTQCAGKPAQTTVRTESVAAPSSAEDAAAASEAAPSSTKRSVQPRTDGGGCTKVDGPLTNPAASTPRAASTESATAPKPTGDGPPPDIEALAKTFPTDASSRGLIEFPPEEHTTTDAQLAKVVAVVAKRAAAPTPTASGPTEAAAAAPAEGPLFAQPGSPFSQPGAVEPAAAAVPMTVQGEQIAARLKEMFYAYTNRTDRSTQTTLGPSEIGSPCDRRIAMSLLRIAPVNPGGDNWASFVGTCVHTGLADMFLWADAGQGRYAVETPLQFPSVHVPRGTADLLDRTLVMVADHKAMGRWSLDKLKTQGPSPTYRVQVHVYAYGMRLKGEAVDHVALVAWPREASSLDDLYVWTEPYDPAIARDALARVDRIAETTERLSTGENAIPALEVASYFAVNSESCRFCPWFAPGDPTMKRGCPGR
ncbi:hypothetical protein [Streptomyces venezuelae]|uniref:hypothetical protein n=1 Tax=Streptomyces venezuelae TaxID=54571 RepID=UPI00123C04DF|nr:hypothetical protein [Streptomyces venezuelae]